MTDRRAVAIRIPAEEFALTGVPALPPGISLVRTIEDPRTETVDVIVEGATLPVVAPGTEAPRYTMAELQAAAPTAYTAAEVRAWAAAHGWPHLAGQRGRVPAAATQAHADAMAERTAPELLGTDPGGIR